MEGITDVVLKGENIWRIMIALVVPCYHLYLLVSILKEDILFSCSRCAVITEFARDLLAQQGVKVVVPGEKEGVVVSLSEETNEAGVHTEGKNGSEELAVKATVGEKCEVCEGFLGQLHTSRFLLL